jgi:hypothetical protein
MEAGVTITTWEQCEGAWEGEADMLKRIRQSLQARLDGRNEGGDIEVMRLVDEIVKKEGQK